MGRRWGHQPGREARALRGWLGWRTPTSSLPAVTASGMAWVRGSRRVRGPGQNAAMRRVAEGEIWAMAGSWPVSAMWTISGSTVGALLGPENLLDGRGGQRVCAEAVDGVRWGKRTVWPVRRRWAARAMSAGLVAWRRSVCLRVGTLGMVLPRANRLAEGTPPVRPQRIVRPLAEKYCLVPGCAPGADVYSAMQAAEIELKFPVASLSSLERSLRELGFRVVTERTFESKHAVRHAWTHVARTR